MTTELALTQPMQIDYSNKEIVATIRSTVAIGATDAEFQIFIGMCRATGLNPFKKEIWFIKPNSYTDKSGKRVDPPAQIMAGINGFYEIANSNAVYDGIENTFGPEIEIDLGNGEKIIAFEWVETSAFRKDRSRPQVFRAYWREYAKDLLSYAKKQTIWAKMPSVMLTKCADAMALRKLFPQQLNGVYAEEEMPIEYSLKALEKAQYDLVDVHKVNGKPKPADPETLGHHLINAKILKKDEFATYVCQYSPNVPEIDGKMIQDIDPEFFELLAANKEMAAQIDERDLVNLRQHYIRNHKGQLTKAEQSEQRKAKGNAAPLEEGTVREAVIDAEAA